MPDQINLTFLGTAAGRPCQTRNVSSLAIKLDRAIWVVDAGEGTQHQFMNDKCKLKMGQVTKIFITHMHADHIMGLPGLLCTISAGEGSVLPGHVDPRLEASASPSAKPTEIYGPKGLRFFLRQSLASTYSILTRPYVVHELLFPDESPTITAEEDLHPSERVGRDIPQKDGVWEDIETAIDVKISAGPILHTVPCIGYIFSELPRPRPLQPALYIPHLMRPVNAAALKSQGFASPQSYLSVIKSSLSSITLEDGTILTPPGLGGPGRKIVVLGDTFDATGCAGLAQDADLVVHESTNAFIPEWDESQRKEGVTADSVRETAKEHGHSTPDVAGGFARKVGARLLALNHLSVKYPDVGDEEVEGEGEGVKGKRECLREIRRLAKEAFVGVGSVAESERDVVVARDFMVLDVKRRE
ncbi:ribonuclease Z [Pseudohyphozyma bogoriensis]|nr:ribonuclease Z [Pseudohyphozyma bogoriensis]